MSFLFKPSGGTAGTAVDPLGPGGVLIDPSEITQPGYAAPGAPAGYILSADGAGGWVIGPNAGGGLPDNRFTVQFSHNAGVPSFGTRYLRYGQGVPSSQAGFRMIATGRLRGITVQIDTPDTEDYVIEVLTDPAARAGSPVVIGSLSLPAGGLFNVDRTFLAAVTASDEIGVRIRRTTGATASVFTAINVKTEFSIP